MNEHFQTIRAPGALGASRHPAGVWQAVLKFGWPSSFILPASTDSRCSEEIWQHYDQRLKSKAAIGFSSAWRHRGLR